MVLKEKVKSDGGLKNKILTVAAVGLAALCSSCSSGFINKEYSLKGITSKPKPTMGTYATDSFGTTFMGRDLGKHNYWGRGGKKGIVYTSRGGHIDIAHIRKAIDYTGYLGSRTYNCLMNNKEGFSFGFTESSKYFVEFKYPDYWEDLDKEKKSKIAEDISINLGEYFSYTGNTFHEMLTWFGFRSTIVFPEFPSAFSWEDNHSNFLGAYIGAEALRDKKDFNEAATLALDNELAKLGIQPKQIAKRASAQMRGEWYTGDGFVNMKQRNFEIGLNGGDIIPTLVPGICPGATPLYYKAPTTDVLSKHGFSMKFEIDPRDKGSEKIKKIVGKNRIDPEKDFYKIIDEIKKDADKKGYNY